MRVPFPPMLLPLAFSYSYPPGQAGYPLEGHWQGMWVHEGAPLEIAFDFTRDREGFRGTFSPQGLRAISLPLSHIIYSALQLHFEIAGDSTSAIFDGHLEGDAITGTFVDGENQGHCMLKRIQAETTPCQQAEACFEADARACAPQGRPAHEPEFLPANLFCHSSGAACMRLNIMGEKSIP